MGAYVNYKFKNGFILDEERVRKINEILYSRGNQIDPKCKPIYNVYREDTFSYSTENITDIFQEENSEWKHINRILIQMNFPGKFSLTLNFDFSEDTYLAIEGEDRDTVFLIFSELRQYISSEVSVINLFFEKISKEYLTVAMALLFALMAVFVSLIAASSRVENTPILYNEAVKSQDEIVKLNYLLQRYSSSAAIYQKNVIYFMVASFSVVIMFLVSRGTILRPIQYLFPGYLFLFGKEIEKHNKRLTLRQNLLWGSSCCVNCGNYNWPNCLEFYKIV
ncbi:MAG: hypothetical protein U0Z26_19210 [Anaerolineales bacterium]